MVTNWREEHKQVKAQQLQRLCVYGWECRCERPLRIVGFAGIILHPRVECPWYNEWMLELAAGG